MTRVIRYLCISKGSATYTPDVATWNKEIRINDDVARVIADRFNDAEKIQTPLTVGIGLREKKASKKDLIIDPANKKEVDEAIKSGSTLTDEALNCPNNVIGQEAVELYNLVEIVKSKIMRSNKE